MNYSSHYSIKLKLLLLLLLSLTTLDHSRLLLSITGNFEVVLEKQWVKSYKTALNTLTRVFLRTMSMVYKCEKSLKGHLSCSYDLRKDRHADKWSITLKGILYTSSWQGREKPLKVDRQTHQDSKTAPVFTDWGGPQHTYQVQQ